METDLKRQKPGNAALERYPIREAQVKTAPPKRKPIPTELEGWLAQHVAEAALPPNYN
jgi:hypothetical protein